MRLKSIAGLAGLISAISAPQMAEAQPIGLYRSMILNSNYNSDSNAASAARLSQLRFEEAKSVKPGELINPFLNSLISVRVENAYDEKDSTLQGEYRRKTVFGEGAFQDSQINISLYPYKYEDGEFEVKVSLEGVLMDSFYGDFRPSRDMIKVGSVNLADYKNRAEINGFPKSDDLWDMKIEVYRIPCGGEMSSEPEEIREIVIDQHKTYAQSLKVPTMKVR